MYDANFGPDAGGGAIAVYADGATAASDVTLVSFAGTTEDVECSGRGLCDRDSGVCVCFPGYASSDGVGGVGTQGDCGRRALCNAAWCSA